MFKNMELYLVSRGAKLSLDTDRVRTHMSARPPFLSSPQPHLELQLDQHARLLRYGHRLLRGLLHTGCQLLQAVRMTSQPLFLLRCVVFCL